MNNAGHEDIIGDKKRRQSIKLYAVHKERVREIDANDSKRGNTHYQ